MDPSSYHPPIPAQHEQYSHSYPSFELLNPSNGSEAVGLQNSSADEVQYDQDASKVRVKRKRASKACDACRVRKVKCDSSLLPCPQCAEHEIPCQFTVPAKKRGPPNAYVEAQKLRQAQQAEQNSLFQPGQSLEYPANPVAMGQPYGHAMTPNFGSQNHQAHYPSFGQPQSVQSLGLEQLAGAKEINATINDFFSFCYPTVPLIIEPLFLRVLGDNSKHTPEFLALCGSMIAMTLTMLRPDPARYGSLTSQDAYLFSTKNLGLNYRDHMTVDILTTLAFLSMAASYSTDCPLFENLPAAILRAEFFTGTQYFAAQELKESNLSFADEQRLKRMLIFIAYGELTLGIQSLRVPSAPITVLFGSHKITPDTMPLDISDTDMERINSGAQDPAIATTTQFSDVLEPKAQSYVAGLKLVWEMHRQVCNTATARSDESRSVFDRYLSCRQTLDLLHRCLDNAPKELRWQEDNKAYGIGFEVQKANIYISRMHLSSLVLEQCVSLAEARAKSDGLDAQCLKELELQRRLVTRDTLKILKTISRSALEANGAALLTRVRQVALTLLDVIEHDSVNGSPESQAARRELDEYMSILGILDQKKTISPSEANNLASAREDGWRRFMERSDLPRKDHLTE